MFKIGFVNIDTSHPKAFAQFLMDKKEVQFAGVYNDGFRGDDEVEAFIKKFNIKKRFNTIEELADCSDIGFIMDCNWDKHLAHAMPFIERGKPVFMDKPLVGNIKECIILEKLVSEGKVILGSSSVRYADTITEFISKPIEERGKIVNVFGTSGVDEFNYGIHIVEAIGGLMGKGAVSVKFNGRAEVDNKICDTYMIKYKNGVTAVYNTFIGTYMPFVMVIMTTKATYNFRVKDSTPYASLLNKICDYMETGKNNLASIDELTEAIKILLAARISRENNGKEIKITDIPDNDKGYDGYEFEKGYAAAAKKIYLD